MDRKFIADRITQLRLDKNLSERELSLSIGKGNNYINSISSGRSLPSMDSFLEICDFFEITPFDFFYPNESNPQTVKKIYDEIIRISNNKNLSEFLLLLETATPSDFSTLISFLYRYQRNITKNHIKKD